jgi:hypothetical protein
LLKVKDDYPQERITIPMDPVLLGKFLSLCVSGAGDIQKLGALLASAEANGLTLAALSSSSQPGIVNGTNLVGDWARYTPDDVTDIFEVFSAVAQAIEQTDPDGLIVAKWAPLPPP